MQSILRSRLHSAFKPDINKSDIKTVLKAVADWQIRTPLTHHPADWTNGALYAGMVEWAGIAGNDSYYEWLKGISEKLDWSLLCPGIILSEDIMLMIIVLVRLILNYTGSIRIRI